MPRLKSRKLMRNHFQLAGDLILDGEAERREAELDTFNADMAAYIAETDALRRAGRPLSERKLAPPKNNPYETTGAQLAGESLNEVGNMLAKVAGVLLLVALSFGIVIVQGLVRTG